MEDSEINHVLDDAGFRYDPAAGLYMALDPHDPTDYSAPEIASDLEIPLDDLMRWEQRQRHEDETAPD